MSTRQRLVVVGASLAGLHTAEAVRRGGFDGAVTLIGDELHLPYDRPPLSKQFLHGVWEADRTAFRTKEELRRSGIELAAGLTAVSLDIGRRPSVVLDSGDRVPYDLLVLATGARARKLGNPDLAGVYTLRTLEDAHSIRRAFGRRPRVTVVGGGFIGAEVAAAARASGLEVTIVEALPAPMSRVLGSELGNACADLHRENGVRVLCGTGVERLEGETSVSAVLLTDGTRIPAELVIVGIGAIPNDEWLQDSGALDIDNGVVCDQFGSAAENIYAVGDVARWWHPTFQESIRVEHWAHAREQAGYVAGRICEPTGHAAFASVPYVWSDQYDVKIQIAGRPGPSDVLHVVHGDPASKNFLALYGREGIVTGAVAFNNPQGIARARRLIAGRPQVGDAVAVLAATGGRRGARVAPPTPA